MSEQIRQMILEILRQMLTAYVVMAVPEGVAVLSENGQHTLIRVQDARLET